MHERLCINSDDGTRSLAALAWSRRLQRARAPAPDGVTGELTAMPAV
jgi:hypothetical protein